jgi:hypothetical protein
VAASGVGDWLGLVGTRHSTSYTHTMVRNASVIAAYRPDARPDQLLTPHRTA